MNRLFWSSAMLCGLLLSAGVTGGESPANVPPRLTLQQLRQMYASPVDRVIDVDGVEVYYRDEGQGPAILLIHGSNSTLRTYDDVARQLSQHYRVVRYDIPPNGLSGPVPNAVVGRLRPSDVPAHILAKLGIRKVTVAGVSSGGTTAIFLAAEYPQLVERVIVSCSPSDPVDMSKLKRSAALEEAERTYGGYLDASRAKPKQFWRIYADFYSGVPGRMSDRTVQEMYDFSRRIPDDNATALVGVVADQPKAIAAMNAVRVPVLLLWGASDPLLPPPAALTLSRHLINASVSILLLPDVSHYPPIEVPERYAAILVNYIEQVTPLGNRQ